MLSFIGAFLLIFLLSVALGGIPFVLIIIFVEMSGNADYMRAITWGLYSVIQCTNFIAYLCGREFEFSISLNISEIIENTVSVYSQIDSNVVYAGIKSETETFIHNLNKIKYLFSLCV